tara:strand:+ start:291 stop:1478 length:1188 start_codon:yes stop_codon:yes gene_type:complete
MRILLVSLFYEHEHGGAEMVAREAARLVRQERGWEVDVLCLAGGNDHGDPKVFRMNPPTGFRGDGQAFKRAILFLPNRLLDNWLLQAANRAGVQSAGYDVIFCPDMNALVLAHQLAQAADKPLTVWCQEVTPKRMDGLATQSSLAPSINRWLTGRDRPWREAFCASQRVACVSDFIRNRTLKFTGEPDNAKYATLYQPVEDYFQQPTVPAVSADEPAQVLFYGRLSAEKGIDLLLDVWREHQPKAKLSILGMDGPLSGQVHEAANHADITVLSPVPHHEVPGIMAAHDIVCCPSRVEESLCRTALEARLMHRVVVAGASGAIPEVLRDYPLAHLAKVRSVESNDPEPNQELADALKTALSNRRPLTADEKESELSFRQQFLPEIFLDEFVKLVEG